MFLKTPRISWRKLIFIGLLIRLLFSFWTGNPSDFEIFIRVGYHVAHGASPTQAKFSYVTGLGQPIYDYVSGIGYLPAWGLCAALAYKIYRLLPFSPYFYYFLLKLFPIVGDLTAMYLIFVLVKRFTHDVKRAEKASIIFFICPFVIFISSVWGMFDSIPISFTLLSVLLLLSNRLCWSALSLGLGIYFKVIPIIYLPIPLIFLIKTRSVKDPITYFLISGATPLALTLTPMLWFGWKVSETATTVLSQTLRIGEGITYWNIFSLLRDLFPKTFSKEFLGLLFSFPPVRYLWILGLMASYLSYFRYHSISEHVGMGDLYTLSKWFSITTISFLLTRTFIPEQFVMYVLFTASLILGISENLSLEKYYFYTWLSALSFALVNFYPFVFAYLLNIEWWHIFNHLTTVKPFSTLRYITRSILALIFCICIIKVLACMVKRNEKNNRNVEG